MGAVDPVRRVLLLGGATSLLIYAGLRLRDGTGRGSAYAGEDSTGSGGKPPLPGGIQRGVNVYPGTYYWAHRNFIDILRDTGDDRMNGIPADQVNGATVLLHRGDEVYRYAALTIAHTGGFRTGNYIIKAVDTPQRSGIAAARLTLKLSGVVTGVTRVVAGTRCTFTVTSDTPQFGVAVMNNTRSDQTFHWSNIVCMHEDDEALFDAGEIFNPLMLADLEGCSVLRFLDCNGANFPRIQTIADIPTMESWIGSDWPPEIIAALCRRLGAEGWINLPIVMDDLMFSADADTDRITTARWIEGTGAVAVACPWSEGDAVMPCNVETLEFAPGLAGPKLFYARNISGNTCQLSVTPDGPVIDIKTTVPLSHAELWINRISKMHDPAPVYEEYAARLHAAWPECPMWSVEAGNEKWNFSAPFSVLQAWCRTQGFFRQFGVPNDGARDALARSQTRAGAGSLTLNGDGKARHTGTGALAFPTQLTISSSANLGGVTFTFNGKDPAGKVVSYRRSGPDNGTVETDMRFSELTSISVSGALAGDVTVGYPQHTYGPGNIWVDRTAWKSFIKVFGAAKVRPQANVQLWEGLIADWLYLPDDSVFNDGKTYLAQLRDLGGELSFAPYTFPQHTELDQYKNHSAWTWDELVAARCWQWTDAQWKGYLAHVQTSNSKYMTQWNRLIARYAPGLGRSAYEMGQHGFATNFADRTAGDDQERAFAAWMGFWFHSTSREAREARAEYLAWFQANGFNRINHYVSVGGWSWNGRHMMAWGRKRTYAAADRNEWSAAFDAIGTPQSRSAP